MRNLPLHQTNYLVKYFPNEKDNEKRCKIKMFMFKVNFFNGKRSEHFQEVFRI